MSADRDSNSLPRNMHTTDNSSCGSEHVLSPSPDLPDRDHAESQPAVGGAGTWFGVCDWGGADDGFVVEDDAGALFGPASPAVMYGAARDAALLNDMFAYLQRPF